MTQMLIFARRAFLGRQEDGFSVNTTDPSDPSQFILQPQDSDIVCFISNPDDEHGAHSAIVTSDSGAAFPPNT